MTATEHVPPALRITSSMASCRYIGNTSNAGSVRPFGLRLDDCQPARQQHRDPSFARELSVWLDRVLTWYGDRVLGVDVPTARRWGRLSGDLGHESADLIIAATALEHGLTVVSRNTRHFEPAGVQVFDPFGGSEEPDDG